MQSYIIACTPRTGSHLLADGLQSTGVAGRPDERFPRYPSGFKLTREMRDVLTVQGLPDSAYDAALDAKYVADILRDGTTANGVFGVNIHWFQVNDAKRRVEMYAGRGFSSAHEAFSSAFPNLSYVWLRRRDKVEQAVSWYKAVMSGHFIKTSDSIRSIDHNTSIEFDFYKIKEYLAKLRSFDNGWANYFSSAGIEPLVLYYDELSNNYRSSVLRVLRALRLDCSPQLIAAPRHVKAADRQSEAWILRFKQMNAHL